MGGPLGDLGTSAASAATRLDSVAAIKASSTRTQEPGLPSIGSNRPNDSATITAPNAGGAFNEIGAAVAFHQDRIAPGDPIPGQIVRRDVS